MRRAEAVGPRAPGQPFDEWLARSARGPDAAGLLGSSPDDDVADPIGLPVDGYERTAAELDGGSSGRWSTGLAGCSGLEKGTA